MAKKSCKPTGTAITTYLNAKGSLITVRDDGTRWGKSIHHPQWMLLGTKKADVPFETWKAGKLAAIDALPWWATKVKSLPSMKTLEAWATDSVCETVTGYEPVEPDGHGPDGAPSWLLALGMI